MTHCTPPAINLTDYYTTNRQHILDHCKACGLCIKTCPTTARTSNHTHAPRDIQHAVLNLLTEHNNQDTELAATHILSCMGCFACVDSCPTGLNPLLINEIAKWHQRITAPAPQPYTDPADPEAPQRILASIQTTPQDYQRITTPTPLTTARYVFFPGCNVYAQPDKILQALDILGIITDDYAFIPGLNNCCGDVHLFNGAPDHAHTSSTNLINTFASYSPQTVIFWCSTCVCRFHTLYAHTTDIPFTIQTFTQFLADHIHTIPFYTLPPTTVTLHEACKAAYTGIDINSPRAVLRNIPGLTLTEMPRHAHTAACCGGGALYQAPEAFAAIRNERMQEAADTHADILVDICHFCHETFVSREPDFPYTVTNYITLVAQALGIQREDTLKHYKQTASLAQILNDAYDYIARSPYTREQIIAALTTSGIATQP